MKKQNKRLLFLLVIAMLSTLFAGCGTSKTETNADAEKTLCLALMPISNRDQGQKVRQWYLTL